MLFYVLVIPTLIMAMYFIYSLLKVSKHDRVLYVFCQIRRDVMGYLRENGLTMPNDHYTALRRLLKILNNTIHYYNEHKTSLFNIRNFFRFLDELKKSKKNIEKIEIPDVDEIKSYYSRYSYNMFNAFFAYTPFIRSEIVIIAFLFLLKTLRRIVGSIYKDHIRPISKAVFNLQWLQTESKNVGIKLSYIQNGRSD